MKNPWRIQIVNGRGIKVQNRNGGSYMPVSYTHLPKAYWPALLQVFAADELEAAETENAVEITWA